MPPAFLSFRPSAPLFPEMTGTKKKPSMPRIFKSHCIFPHFSNIFPIILLIYPRSFFSQFSWCSSIHPFIHPSINQSIYPSITHSIPISSVSKQWPNCY
jgi:hypothetical protein